MGESHPDAERDQRSTEHEGDRPASDAGREESPVEEYFEGAGEIIEPDPPESPADEASAPPPG